MEFDYRPGVDSSRPDFAKLTSHRVGVHTKPVSHRGPGITGLVPAGCLRDVMVAQLPSVHSPLNPTLLKLLGDGPVVDAEICSEASMRAVGPEARYESIDFGRNQSTLDGPSQGD
ncbi:MAG: hypothetical protein ACLQPH_13165 [Acidimicrobiales bacterium]